MVVVKNLRRTFGPIVAVDKMSFSAEKGEVLGIVGPNGAGKSTAMWNSGRRTPTSRPNAQRRSPRRSARHGGAVRRATGPQGDRSRQNTLTGFTRCRSGRRKTLLRTFRTCWKTQSLKRSPQRSPQRGPRRGRAGGPSETRPPGRYTIRPAELRQRRARKAS